MIRVRPTRQDDIQYLKIVLDETSFFPSEMLPEMIDAFFSNTENEDVWLTCENNGTAIGFCYAVPEQLAEGTWNMLAIAVLPSKQCGGAGSAIVKELEASLSKRGQRVLIADTSGANASSMTRKFYRKNGYAEEARIRDFWAAGDDKIIFWKSLSAI